MSAILFMVINLIKCKSNQCDTWPPKKKKTNAISLNSKLNIWKGSANAFLKKSSVWVTIVKITIKVWRKNIRILHSDCFKCLKFSLHFKETETGNCRWYILMFEIRNCKTPNSRPIFNEKAMMYAKRLGTHTYSYVKLKENVYDPMFYLIFPFTDQTSPKCKT